MPIKMNKQDAIVRERVMKDESPRVKVMPNDKLLTDEEADLVIGAIPLQALPREREKIAATATGESLMPNEPQKPPFAVDEIVISQFNDMRFIKEGHRYRVVSVKAESDCGSGWMVSVATVNRGRRPKQPRIVGTVDSEWFISKREADHD